MFRNYVLWALLLIKELFKARFKVPLSFFDNLYESIEAEQDIIHIQPIIFLFPVTHILWSQSDVFVWWGGTSACCTLLVPMTLMSLSRPCDACLLCKQSLRLVLCEKRCYDIYRHNTVCTKRSRHICLHFSFTVQETVMYCYNTNFWQQKQIRIEKLTCTQAQGAGVCLQWSMGDLESPINTNMHVFELWWYAGNLGKTHKKALAPITYKGTSLIDVQPGQKLSNTDRHKTLNEYILLHIKKPCLSKRPHS